MYGSTYVGEERKVTEESSASSSKAHFFVYCKDCPKTLQTGKLRVRCHRCQEGSILIHRDPCGWSDVLEQPGTYIGKIIRNLRVRVSKFYPPCNMGPFID